MNAILDEEEHLEVVDAYADYMALFINPEAARQVIMSQPPPRSQMVNKEAESLMERARRNEELPRKSRPDIAEKVKLFRERKLQVKGVRKETRSVEGVEDRKPRPRDLEIARKSQAIKRRLMDNRLIRMGVDPSTLEWI